MSYTEVTTEGWFSRIGGAIKGIIAGLALIPISAIVLFWNEGREVKRTQDLQEGKGAIVSIEADSIDSSNDGKLVHITGSTTTDDTITDDIYELSVENAVKLQRIAEYYQFKENVKSKEKKNLGGSKTTEKTYTYEKQWVSDPIDSSSFKEADKKNTTVHQVDDKTSLSSKVNLGKFRLSNSQLGKISADQKVRLSSSELEPASENDNYKVAGNYFYHGENPNSPTIGDVRVSFMKAPVGEISIIAQQKGESFVSYQAKNNVISMLEPGIKSSDEMFAAAQASNKQLSWIIRLVGVIVMTVGFGMIFKPLSVVMDVVPFLGSIVGFGAGLIAILLSITISSGIIAVAWLFYRPLISICLFGVMGLAAFFIYKHRAKKVTA